MWLFAMFDLPVKTRRQRREYTRFRKSLLREGFSRLQFSVYARYCMSEELSTAQCHRIRDFLPPEGQSATRLLHHDSLGGGRASRRHGYTPLGRG